MGRHGDCVGGRSCCRADDRQREEPRRSTHIIAGVSASIGPARPDDDKLMDPANTSPSTEIDRIRALLLSLTRVHKSHTAPTHQPFYWSRLLLLLAKDTGRRGEDGCVAARTTTPRRPRRASNRPAASFRPPRRRHRATRVFQSADYEVAWNHVLRCN